MRILLTGASGYIGLHIVRELISDGHEVTAVVRSPAKLGVLTQASTLRVVTADIEQRGLIAKALEGQDVCIHAALLWGAPGTELDMRDTVAAAKLFEDAGRAGVARCVFISSSSVHRPFSLAMREEDPLTTADYYGATKAAGETFLRAACVIHRMTGVVIRPGPVVGPPAFDGASFRMDGRIAETVTAALQGRPICVTHGDGRQFCDVATLARVTCALVRLEDPHPTYACVDAEVCTWEWIARNVVACLSSRSEVRVGPAKEGPIPRFRTKRVDELLGHRIDSRDAVLGHIRHLARSLASPS